MPRVRKIRAVPQKPGPGGVEYYIHPQGQHQTGVQQAFDRHLRVAVRPASQQRLSQNAGKAANGGKDPRLPAGKAPPQQQRGLVAREDGKHGPVDHVDQRIGYVQPPQRGEFGHTVSFPGISRPSRGSKSTPSRIGRSSVAVRSAQARTNAAPLRRRRRGTPPRTRAPVRTLENTSPVPWNSWAT